MKLTEAQWFMIFDYVWTLLLSCGYTALMWYFDCSVWLVMFIVHFEMYSWYIRRK